MKMLAFFLVCLLTACGGGALDASGPITVQVQPGAVTCSGCNLVVNVPSAAASAVVSTPSVAVPLATMQAPPVMSSPGAVRWTAGGMTYVLAVVSAGDMAWIDLYSAPTVSSDPVRMTTVECVIDDGLDLHWPANSDAAVRSYLVSVLPKVQTCIQQLSGRFGAGIALSPVSTLADLPVGISAPDRLAARMAQWVAISATGASIR